MKRMNTYGRVGKRKRGFLIGYDRMTSKYHIGSDKILTNVDSPTSWVEGARNRYTKSIILQKESSLLLKEVIHWGQKNEKVNKAFLRLVKDSLNYNPFNIGSLFNLVYFYFMRIEHCGSPSVQIPTREERSCLLYSYLLHSILLHIFRGQFSREKAAVLKGRPRGRNIRGVFFSLFKEEMKKHSFEIRLVRCLWDRWNTIPCISDHTLLIIFLENMNMLCMINCRMGFMRNVFYYSNFMEHLVQLRRFSGLLKANYFSLSASLCMAKAACFVLTCSGDQRIHHVMRLGELNSADIWLANAQKEIGTRSPMGGVVDLATKDSSPIRYSTSHADKEGNTVADDILPHTLLKCEERFLSFLLSEEETVMRAKDVVEENYILEGNVHHSLSSVIKRLNLCINHCLSHREYHSLAELLMWRARLYYHVGLFRECLSDTSKVALINLHASAPLRIDTEEEEDEEGGGTGNYSCLGLMLSCLHRLNLLRPSDSYLLIPLMRGKTGSYTWKGKSTCTRADHAEKNHTFNKREHAYSWCRPAEDKILLRVLHGNRKKIPFIL
ncbi:conserved Plasmodium protein, unknown function [Plasmodium knowlesi strain H]|uniref:Uncharacterized protein n=3 Tax=Plasmodium knowlesi TaxID=5850 RepID=A0A5K1UN29_PLAKH|nr:conserved Plasmodium protein, unknown function [Plasmodium knowlesi strain H]OTN66380.1 Uncharacterized protein PKNOH_S09528400 [Plasmodium knowlesi]CAA9990023.1 conserved Plasmodium protein, unknown function [Plasmodium knowlesi strain H]SBO24627.1 conserved Plasmodium protein, unknown function [Plasmodium knowlesi strain H]SBO26194.1 conserved Plasmodium protein, unknown function [Plasmodium knowlesi strain H]VVS79497.1 conserved Plasmodium protein, unknown function [Plasmodium knowlesi s|eukprot:XP_002260038.1 hypothetical protein, conserved in Plasmodium species [Plasmodium knowlesi strain H]